MPWDNLQTKIYDIRNGDGWPSKITSSRLVVGTYLDLKRRETVIFLREGFWRYINDLISFGWPLNIYLDDPFLIGKRNNLLEFRLTHFGILLILLSRLVRNDVDISFTALLHTRLLKFLLHYVKI